MGRVAGHLLDAEVAIGEARDLRQVRDRDHLRPPGEAAERLADRVCGLAADAGVDLVEDHRLAAADRGDRKGDARELAAGRRLGTGPNGRPPFGRTEKTASSAPAGPGRPRARRAELALAEPDAAELGRDRLREPRRGFAARLAEPGVETVDLGLLAASASAAARAGSCPSASASSSARAAAARSSSSA